MNSSLARDPRAAEPSAHRSRCEAELATGVRITALTRQALDRQTMAPISILPSPEKIFAAWLLSVPGGANLEAAARQQIAIIDRRALNHPDVQYLRMLLLAVARDCSCRKPFANL